MLKRFAIILFVTLVTSALPSYDFDDLSNLGESISASVQKDLEPLQTLGARINAEVERGLQPLRNLRPTNSRNNYGRQSFNLGLGDLGSHISSSVQAGLAPLNNLGQQIEQSVQQGLLPVRAMEIRNSMKNGIGGVAIATHSPSGKQFIFKNGKGYQCKGTVSSTGNCQGNLTPFVVKNDTDFCYSYNSYSIVNNYICIGASSIQIINNNIQCKNWDNSPVLFMKRDQYEDMCKNLSQNVEYKYIADPTQPGHVKIPNDNKYVRCSNNEPNVCVFTESNPLFGRSNVIQNVNNIYSWNSNGVITY